MNVITVFDIETKSIQYIGTLHDGEYIHMIKILGTKDANYGHFHILYKSIQINCEVEHIISSDDNIQKYLKDNIFKEFDRSMWICGTDSKFIPQFINGYMVKSNRYFVFDSGDY